MVYNKSGRNGYAADNPKPVQKAGGMYVSLLSLRSPTR